MQRSPAILHSKQLQCCGSSRRDLHHCGDLHADRTGNAKRGSNHYGQLSWQPSHRATRPYGRGSHGGADPSSLSFPAQAVGTTSPAQQITLTNSGQFNLQVNRIQTSGNFSQINTCGASVTIGLSCTISVVYTPTTLGQSTGTLTITDDAGNSPQTVTLTGTAVAPNIGLAVPTGGSASASVSAGQSATYTLPLAEQELVGPPR
jgi:Abnormal spindle-like microcephaly-assoc'd, ASPM-SPD-2-Hydin